MVGDGGFEPQTDAPKAPVLPLHHIPVSLVDCNFPLENQ